jgi:myo-inositol catabolism protein IolC
MIRLRWWVRPVLVPGSRDVLYEVYEAHTSSNLLKWFFGREDWVLVGSYGSQEEATRAVASWAEVRLPEETLYDQYGQRVYFSMDY